MMCSMLVRRWGVRSGCLGRGGGCVERERGVR